MGDIIKRKNYSLSLEIIASCNNKTLKYLICGKGNELDTLKKQAIELGIEKQVLFLGFRKDVKELLKISDIFLFTTLQEGLPRSLMEAMASGLPCVVSNIRGNNDLIENGKGGFCCNNIEEYVESINYILNNDVEKDNFINYNYGIIKEYDLRNVILELKNIYLDMQ